MKIPVVLAAISLVPESLVQLTLSGLSCSCVTRPVSQELETLILYCAKVMTLRVLEGVSVALAVVLDVVVSAIPRSPRSITRQAAVALLTWESKLAATGWLTWASKLAAVAWLTWESKLAATGWLTWESRLAAVAWLTWESKLAATGWLTWESRLAAVAWLTWESKLAATG
ncbi:hypothetical protein RCO25_29760 [Paenibacillus sp. LHD-38]|nr:hypothetical protein [Paenibacillus sp. LHD-38]MDQ8738635.1 hypothetical protein [Paenibacillus sp. LHD-38]